MGQFLGSWGGAGSKTKARILAMTTNGWTKIE